MKNATVQNRNLVIDILTRAFDANQSVNYIVKQDFRRTARIRSLTDYSYEICSMFDDIFLSDDCRACALILYPDGRKTTPRSILLDLRLITTCIWLRHAYRTPRRNTAEKGPTQ